MNKIKIKQDTIECQNIKKDITLISFADLHFNLNTKPSKLNKIKEAIYKENPDYITISGDLIDYPKITKNETKIKLLLQFLSDLGKHTKVLISLGNHDIFKKEDMRFFEKLNDIYGIYILDNTSYQDDYIYISGFTLPGNYYYNITKDESSEILVEHLNKYQEMTTKINNKLPKISLIHSPIKLTNDKVLDTLSKYDLIISGHTHNGMVPEFMEKLFKDNTGIIAPNKKLHPSIARGKIEKEINNHKLTIIINGGITKLSCYSSKILNKLNFIYNIDLNKITITKKRGIKYE